MRGLPTWPFGGSSARTGGPGVRYRRTPTQDPGSLLLAHFFLGAGFFGDSSASFAFARAAEGLFG